MCVCLVCCDISHSLINSIRTLAHSHSLTTSGTSPGRCLTSAATSPRPLPSRRLSKWYQPSAISSSTQTERYRIVYWGGGGGGGEGTHHVISSSTQTEKYHIVYWEGGGGGGGTHHVISSSTQTEKYHIVYWEGRGTHHAISSSTQTESSVLRGGGTHHVVSSSTQTKRYHIVYWEGGGGGGGHTPCHLIQHPDREIPYSVLAGANTM